MWDLDLNRVLEVLISRLRCCGKDKPSYYPQIVQVRGVSTGQQAPPGNAASARTILTSSITYENQNVHNLKGLGMGGRHLVGVLPPRGAPAGPAPAPGRVRRPAAGEPRSLFNFRRCLIDKGASTACCSTGCIAMLGSRQPYRRSGGTGCKYGVSHRSGHSRALLGFKV